MGFPHFYVLHLFNTLLTLLYENNQLCINRNEKQAVNIGYNMYDIVFKLLLRL